jgi:signal transduction histidine kinase
LAEVGLAPALADMLEKSLGSAGIPVSLNHNESPETRLDSTIEIGLYRIAQELVNNIIKHAKAGKVDVLLMQNATQVLLCVEDDGVGITTSQLNEARSGIGLAGIRSRVSALGGEVSFVAGHAKGTVAMVRIPLITAATSTI